MATLTITVPNADVPDVFDAYESHWRHDATRLFFAGDDNAYLAASQAVKATALIKASIVVTTRIYRYARLTAPEPAVT